MGKGSKPRPMQISRSEFELRWDEAFGVETDDEQVGADEPRPDKEKKCDTD